MFGFVQQPRDANASGQEIVDKASFEFAQLCRLRFGVLYPIIDLVQSCSDEVLLDAFGFHCHQPSNRWQIQASFCTCIVQFTDVGLSNRACQIVANKTWINDREIWPNKGDVLIDIRLTDSIWNHPDDAKVRGD
ncbi:hypothetical protein WS76_00040 [Burkholderia humptydooensis]|nr:hypothetical protein WS76_00040 [Burkholderia humptydooensis]